MEPPVTATARFAYGQFHGTRKYGGKYTHRYLRDWADRLQALSGDVKELYVYFNNDAHGYAVANALQLAEMMGAPYALSAATATAQTE
jgi:uncharacterized protein YecE (DUF72 family)